MILSSAHCVTAAAFQSVRVVTPHHWGAGELHAVRISWSDTPLRSLHTHTHLCRRIYSHYTSARHPVGSKGIQEVSFFREITY